MAIAALVISIVSVFAALYAARVAHHVEESGFKAEEQFKADIVALLSALRSIIVKGTLSADDSTSRSVEREIEIVRTFQASTSGLALAAWAARRGANGESKDVAAGRWRTLSLNLGNIAGVTADGTEQGNVAFNVKLRGWATAVELALEDLTEDSVMAISKNIGDLPGAFAALRESRENDVILKIWFEIYKSEEESNKPENQRGKLEYLRGMGIDDPDIDMGLAFLDDDVEAFKAAIGRGANSAGSINEILARYEEVLARYEADLPGESANTK